MKNDFHILIASVILAVQSLVPTYASAQCQFGEHSTEWADAWISCETSLNPNPARGTTHWIMYDLGAIYALHDSHIWNFNVQGETGLGVRNCFFDLSTNLQDWESFGSWEIEEAPGNDDYTGVQGPNFAGLIGRYLLITVESNWDGDACSGFSEIKVHRDFISTEVDEFDSGIALELFPNPASTTLVVRHYEQGQMSLRVLDMEGRQVHSQTVNRTTSYIDVSTWNSGLYVLTLMDNFGSTVSKRFVVAR